MQNINKDRNMHTKTVGSVHPSESPVENSKSDDDLINSLIGRIDALLSDDSLELPMLPEIANRVLMMTNDESHSAADISKLIHQDQTLASNVLKITNSAQYSGNTKIVSLQQAITRLGFKTISEIALTLSLKGNVFNAKGFENEIKQIWQHALASGSFAKEIARSKRRNVESAYLCGLLHTIGKPIVLNLFTKIDDCRVNIIPPDAIDQILAIKHIEIGSTLVKSWDLPLQVSYSIDFYQKFEDTPTFNDDVMITCLADLLATHLLNDTIISEAYIREHPVVDALNFYPDDVDALLSLKDAILTIIETMSV